MKVLVTGGAGYIGSHTVVELQQAGHEVLIIDNLSNSKIEVIDAIESITKIKPNFFEFDLTSDKKTKKFFKQQRNIDAVVHFAAFKSVGESVKKPLKYYKNNLGSLVNILDALLENNVKNFVFSSSCTVYGQADVLPVSEKAPIKKASSPYGASKQISEEIIEATVNAQNLQSISLRYFNPIGAHHSILIGELPLGVPDNLIPYITQTAIGIRDYLRVFGSDYKTSDGTAIRDYIHVVDLAKAHVYALERLNRKLNKKPYEIFNLGTGNAYSVMDVIKSFERVSKQSLKYKIMDRRSGDIEKVWADATLANKELGWKAEKTLDQMMLSAWKWEQSLQKKPVEIRK